MHLRFQGCGLYALLAATKVACGEELRITYLDLALSVVEQRRRLQEQYHFDAFPALGALRSWRQVGSRQSK